MLDGFKIYDADAHVMMSPDMWADLPKEYAMRRPRPVRIGDSEDLGGWQTSWLVDGRLEPHPFGPGTHAANTPAMTMTEYGADPIAAGDFAGEPHPIGVVDLSDPDARVAAMDDMGIDAQVLFPSTVYASMTSDAGLEAALFRAYNRYVAAQCARHPGRLKWAGLLPMRDPDLGIEALEEMQKLGATTAVVFGTVGEMMLSNKMFSRIWEAFEATGMPLCVHMAMSFPPFEKLCHSIQDANMIGKALPAQIAFVAIVGHGMLDRYPKMKVGFLEFGGEWILYSAGRMKQYMDLNKTRMADPSMLPKQSMDDYLQSGRFFLGIESSDALIRQEIELLGDTQLLYSSDFPHGEGRDLAAAEIIGRTDIDQAQKQKILYDNAVAFFGQP